MNLSGSSGAVADQANDDSILVQFSDRMKYPYTNASAGISNIAEMKRRARAGRRLGMHISARCHSLYAWKGRQSKASGYFSIQKLRSEPFSRSRDRRLPSGSRRVPAGG